MSTVQTTSIDPRDLPGSASPKAIDYAVQLGINIADASKVSAKQVSRLIWQKQTQLANLPVTDQQKAMLSRLSIAGYDARDTAGMRKREATRLIAVLVALEAVDNGMLTPEAALEELRGRFVRTRNVAPAQAEAMADAEEAPY